MPFADKCVVLALYFVLLIVGSIINRHLIKRNREVKFIVVMMFIMLPLLAVHEFAAHFSWAPIIADVSMIVCMICLFITLIFSLVCKNPFPGKSYFSGYGAYIPKRRRYVRRRRNRYKLK